MPVANLPTKSESGGAKLVISGEDIPFGAYQAIYHSLTKKVEKRTKTYREAYTISFADIQNLHQRLVQVTKQFNIKSSRCQVTHQLKDDTSREHSSFERFRLSDCSIRSCTAKINYEFDFLVVLPPEVPEAAEIAQRYRVNVLIDQDFVETDNLDMPYFMRGVVFGRNIQASIEFSDYSVSQTLAATVDGWTDSLPKRTLPGFSRFLLKLEKPVRQYADTIVRSATLLAGALAAYRASSWRDGIYIVLVSIALAFLMFSIVDGLVGKFFDGLTSVKPMTFILITEGDRDRQREIQASYRRTKAVLSFIALGVVVSMLIGVFSNFIYDGIKDLL